MIRTVRAALACLLFFLTLLLCLAHALNHAHTRQCQDSSSARAEWLGCPKSADATLHGEEEIASATAPTAPVTRVGVPRVSPSVASRSRPFTGLTASAPGRLSSTAYCETGLMANGQRTRRYVAAGNRWPLGTVLHVSDSPYGPGDFTVLDRIGHGSDLDFAMPGDCAGARAWGRRTVTVEVVS